MKLWVKTKEWAEGKFLVVRRDGTTPDWPHFVMGARDPCVPAALRAYVAEARKRKWGEDYCSSIEELALDFEQYRMKAGDGDPESKPHRTDNPLAISMMRRETDVAKAADTITRLTALLNEARECLAQCMIRNSVATGHGDTVPDLVDALDDYLLSKSEQK